MTSIKLATSRCAFGHSNYCANRCSCSNKGGFFRILSPHQLLLEPFSELILIEIARLYQNGKPIRGFAFVYVFESKGYGCPCMCVCACLCVTVSFSICNISVNRMRGWERSNPLPVKSYSWWERQRDMSKATSVQGMSISPETIPYPSSDI